VEIRNPGPLHARSVSTRVSAPCGPAADAKVSSHHSGTSRTRPSARGDAASILLERNAAGQWAATGSSFAKPDSGHIGTISITFRVRRAGWNAMKPGIQCVLTQ
jgi:hypothetical protein